MDQSREHLEAALVRHGMIEGLSQEIESGGKPDYDKFIQLVRQESDPPIDVGATRAIIQERIDRGAIKKEDFNLIIHTTALRGQQTAELIKEMLGAEVDLHPSDYLREVRLSTTGVTPDFYEQAAGFKEIHRKLLDNMLNGEKIDEDIVDAYHRAERFLVYLRRIRKMTAVKPLFVSHGFYSRILNLAIQHSGEKLTDDAIREMLKKEFTGLKRPGILEGFNVENTNDGNKIVKII